MATVSEMSHAMNVGNLESLIAFCVASGERYKPTTTNLTIDALILTEIEANNILRQVKVARTNFNDDVEIRRSHFADYKQLIKRVINEILNSNLSDLTISTVIEIQKKIDAVRENSVKKIEIPIENSGTFPVLTKKVTLGQLSFISQLNNFEKLVELLKKEKKYKPNDTTLKLVQLQDELNKLIIFNSNVINSEILLDKLKIIRSAYFYAVETGMVTIALNVKKYIKATFGSSSIHYKQVHQLKFVNIKIYDFQTTL